ncbi:MAG: uridine kinase [Chloroflexi bacterium]|nr:uridine kinase [Chloroflexota bacterium]
MSISTKPLLVGIAGGTASGKTTIARQLERALADLRVRVISMDAYFLREKPRMRGPISGEEFEDHNHPASFDLEGLMADLDACCAADELDVVIVEGLMTLYHEPLRQRLDLRLFVDAPADERIVRRLKRNMAKGLAFDDIAHFYLQSVRFRHEEFVEPSRWHADLVLNGAYPSERGLEVIANWIRGRAL